MGNDDLKIKRMKTNIGQQIKVGIKSTGAPIDDLRKNSVSKTIIYNIINGSENYTIDSLLSVVKTIQEYNPKFNIKI